MTCLKFQDTVRMVLANVKVSSDDIAPYDIGRCIWPCRPQGCLTDALAVVYSTIAFQLR